MERRLLRTFHWPTLLLAGTLLAATGCSRDTERSASAPQAASSRSQALEGRIIELDSLPPIKPEEASQVSLQRLEKGTQLDENVAVHVKLPPPVNKELRESLVRIVGQPESPTVLFNSDALARLGVIPSSPGSEFFTFFSQFDEQEVERRISNERFLASGEQGKVSTKAAVFQGRSPVGITEGIAFDRERFNKFLPLPHSLCPATPISTWAGWGQSLFIKDPAVVLNSARTWDPCTGAGTQGGKWTFAHLIREMATGSGFTAEDFVIKWLEMWVNDYTVNGDVVAARLNMFNEVIGPWATASGISGGPVIDGSGHVTIVLSGPLNLNIAPFRLLAIVNRLDLGKAGSGSTGYGGTTTARPLDAGELRFIFGVVKPNPWGTGGTQGTCGLKPFTVIFEYGVPITGCGNVVQYARKWTDLNTVGGFNATYMTKLEAITQSVVVHGAAPGKGNQSALNQIRTNEAALAGLGEWELREFTLSDENPVSGTDVPSSGLLRKHTVAQTPDDGSYGWTGDAAIDNYVLTTVHPSVSLPVALPNKCSTAHSVPYAHSGLSFRGGNALVSPTHWEATGITTIDDQSVCARHQFSLNTCHGCHAADTGTGFTHVSTSGIPVTMSNFLTGGGPGMASTVADSQFGSPMWPFADLERRWKRMHAIAFCVQCTRVFDVRAEFIHRIADISRVVPIDPIQRPEKLPFEIGPIVDLDQVKQILESRPEFVTEPHDEPVDFIQPADTFVH